MLEEWRSGRDSVGRTHEAHWKTLLEGTKVCCSCNTLTPVHVPLPQLYIKCWLMTCRIYLMLLIAT